MQRDEAVYFYHILDAISYIESYTKDLSKEEFMKNHLIQEGDDYGYNNPFPGSRDS